MMNGTKTNSQTLLLPVVVELHEFDSDWAGKSVIMMLRSQKYMKNANGV